MCFGRPSPLPDPNENTKLIPQLPAPKASNAATVLERADSFPLIGQSANDALAALTAGRRNNSFRIPLIQK